MSPIRNASKLSFSERMEKLRTLTRHLKSLAERSAVRRPAYRMLVARSLLYLIPAVGLGLLAMGSYVLATVFFVLIPMGGLFLLFYDVGQRGRLAYHVARYARDQPSDEAGADAAIEGKRFKLVLLGLAEWFENKLQDTDEDSGLIARVISGIVGEFLDVAGAFLLPAVVLDDVDLDEAARRIKELKDHAPEALLASVGFDAAASMLSSFFWTPLILVAVAAVGGSVAGVLTVSQAGGVAAVLALLLAVPLAATKTLQEAGKAAYFTSLYLLVAHGDEVSGARAGELEELVRMGEPRETAAEAPATPA